MTRAICLILVLQHCEEEWLMEELRVLQNLDNQELLERCSEKACQPAARAKRKAQTREVKLATREEYGQSCMLYQEIKSGNKNKNVLRQQEN